MRPIQSIIIHQSDSTFGNVDLIDQWHRDRGWDEIGYHNVILNGKEDGLSPYDPTVDGTIEYGRAISKMGAHCRGSNRTSIGICLIGKGNSINVFTPAQLQSLKALCSSLINQFGLSWLDVHGHNEFTSQKTCPGFDVKQWALEQQDKENNSVSASEAFKEMDEAWEEFKLTIKGMFPEGGSDEV